MSIIHFKYLFNKNYETISFDGVCLSVTELKKKIFEKAKYRMRFGYDLEIKNADNGQVYKNDTDLVLMNAKVVAKRIIRNPKLQSSNKSTSTNVKHSMNLLSVLSKNLSQDVNATVPDKDLLSLNKEKLNVKEIKTDIKQELPSKPTQVSVGKKQKYKAPKGIPKKNLIKVNENVAGAMLGPDGYVIQILDNEAFKTVKKDSIPFLTDEERIKYNIKKIEPSTKLEIPPALTCPFDNHILKDAIIAPCCGEFICCEECITMKIDNYEVIECKKCHKEIDSIEYIVADQLTRQLVAQYLNDVKLNKTINIENYCTKNNFILNTNKCNNNKVSENTSTTTTTVNTNVLNNDTFNKELLKTEINKTKVEVNNNNNIIETKQINTVNYRHTSQTPISMPYNTVNYSNQYFNAPYFYEPYLIKQEPVFHYQNSYNYVNYVPRKVHNYNCNSRSANLRVLTGNRSYEQTKNFNGFESKKRPVPIDTANNSYSSKRLKEN